MHMSSACKIYNSHSYALLDLLFNSISFLIALVFSSNSFFLVFVKIKIIKMLSVRKFMMNVGFREKSHASAGSFFFY